MHTTVPSNLPLSFIPLDDHMRFDNIALSKMFGSSACKSAGILPGSKLEKLHQCFVVRHFLHVSNVLFPNMRFQSSWQRFCCFALHTANVTVTKSSGEVYVSSWRNSILLSGALKCSNLGLRQYPLWFRVRVRVRLTELSQTHLSWQILLLFRTQALLLLKFF